MDFLGGLFSLVALLLELYINPHTHVNKAKLFLAVMSMVYDVTYMVQHFVLYGDREEATIEGGGQNIVDKVKISPRREVTHEEK